MKKYTLIIALFSCIAAFSQNKVSTRITELKQSKATFPHFSVLTEIANPQDRAIDKVLNKATFAQIQSATVAEIHSRKLETIEIDIPYDNGIKTVELYKVEIFNEGFHVDTDKSASIAYERGVHYRGIVKGDSNSVVSMNFFNNEMNGIISDSQVQNLVIGRLDKTTTMSDYIIYSDAEMKVINAFNCSYEDDPRAAHDHQSEEAAREIESARCVTVYFEVDNDLYVQNGSSTVTTTNWVTSVFNNVQTLYANDGITIALRSMYIWTTDDPYEGNSSFAYLSQFHNLRPVFDGDVGQLIGIDPGGLGGVARTIEGLCSQDNYSYSDVEFGYSTVPTFSWTVMVITHELGHLLGSPHTHACTWNGNNTAIDNCAPFATGSTAEGFSCMTDPPTIPSSSVRGTIMSYCHLVSGVGINFNNGFGLQPKQRILSAVNSSTCLSTDCINTCINTITGLTATNNSNTSITVNWTDVGPNTTWQVALMNLSAVFPSWQTVTGPTHTFTNLTPNTYYKVRVRPMCPGLTATYLEQIVATPATWCAGVTITDTGGAANAHGNLETYVRTFIPSEADKKIVLTFTAFNLEADFDYLYVYDGPSTNSPSFNLSGFTGTTIPGPFVSSAPDGSLTIKFVSDELVTEAGYVATVACQNMLGLASLTSGVDFSYSPNPTNGIVSIIAKSEMTDVAVYNIAGQLLYQRKLNGTENQVDLSAFSTGTYFFKLRFNDIETNFKILKY
ncbi:MAG TPA: M12 family metallo-peptidase [Flavobacterium sp.]|jgi:hypothetical protein